MANQCVNMVEAYLDQLREEGCKLIQWSDDLKHHLPPGPSTPSHSGSGTFLAGKQNAVPTFASPPVDSSSPIQGDLLSPGGNTTPSNNARNFDQFQLNSLDTSQLAKEFPHLSGQNDVHRLLMILYNNYKFVLKKYEELNEQKLSYIEGLKEYQYKLDNSNYLIQLQRSQLSNLTNVAPSNPDLAANSGAVAAGWLNKEHTLLNRERELIRLKEEELMSKEEELKSTEASFVGREEALMAQQLELNGKEADLVAREQELASRQEALADRESDLAARETELAERESELTERERLLAENEELFKAKQDEFLSKGSRERHKDPSHGERDKSIFVEEHGEVVYKAVRPNTNHGKTDINDAGAQGTNGAANKSYEDEEMDNEAINSTYIQNMNANNDGMHVLKKNLFNKAVLKSCTLRIEDNSLLFKIKSNPFKLPLKEITRLHFGQESQSYQIHNKNRATGNRASCYFTIHTHSNKDINMYCDNEHNIRTWRNGLNRVLLKQNAANILAGDSPSVPAANVSANADHDATTSEQTNRGGEGTVG